MTQSDIEQEKRKRSESNRKYYELKRKLVLEQQAVDAQRSRIQYGGGNEEDEDDDILDYLSVQHSTANTDHAQADVEFKTIFLDKTFHV